MVQVASPTPSPTPGQSMSQRLTGLTTGTLYSVVVSAVDSAGLESACSSVASAVARADFSVSPTGTVNFGSVNLGSSANQTVTVSNTGGGTVSGTVSVAAPFSIVSGSPFTLGGVGASQAITVRFTPTTTTTVSTTLTVAAGGGTVSDIMTGSGSAVSATGSAGTPSPSGSTGSPGDTTPPTVAVTTPVAGTRVKGTVTISANATDNVGVAGVQFKLDGVNLGAAVTAPPYTIAWTTTATTNGTHVLSAVAQDAAGNVATSAGVSVSVANWNWKHRH